MRSKPARGSRKAETVAIAPKASVPARKRHGGAKQATTAVEAVASVAEPIEWAGLRDQRAALGPAARTRRDPDAPRRFILLDATASVLADATEPMQVKAIGQLACLPGPEEEI